MKLEEDFSRNFIIISRRYQMEKWKTFIKFYCLRCFDYVQLSIPP